MKKKKAIENQRRKPTQQRSKLKYQAILDAVPQVLVNYGYDKCTTDEIALEAEVSIGTLYQYFEDKDDVIEAYMDEQLKLLCFEILENVSSSNTSQNNNESVISIAVSCAVDFLYGRLDIMSSLRRDIPRFIAKANDKYLFEQVRIAATSSNQSDANGDDFLFNVEVITHAGIGLMTGLILSKKPHDKSLVKFEMTTLIESYLNAKGLI